MSITATDWKNKKAPQNTHASVDLGNSTGKITLVENGQKHALLLVAVILPPCGPISITPILRSRANTLFRHALNVISAVESSS